MPRNGHPSGAVLKPLVALGKTPDACWRWLGNHSADGVPTKTFGGKTMPARRWLWATLFGPIPDGLIITTMQACGDKGCVNPHHLRACFQAEANRAGVGALLMPADVAELRAARKKGLNSARVLAEQYGVSTRAIHDIWSRRSWSKPKPNNGPNRTAAA